MRPLDPLERAKSRPAFVERMLRAALHDALGWRIGGGRAPSAESFVTAAVAAARLNLAALDGSSGERSRTLAAVQRVGSRFAASALFRRLMHVPAARFLRLAGDPGDADVIVRDRRRRLHAVALTIEHDAFAASRIATRVASVMPLPAGDRLMPVTVHVFSLATGHRLTFERDVFEPAVDHSAAGWVA
jgi:hypothetical protein